MTNDETPNDEGTPKPEARSPNGASPLDYWEFELPSSLGVSSFVISAKALGNRPAGT
jgi:hypothetical protein